MTTNHRTDKFLAKLFIIGDEGVGKAHLMFRFVEGTFTSSPFLGKSVDPEFRWKTLEIEEKEIKLFIWKNFNERKLKLSNRLFKSEPMGIIITYAINNRKSFENIENHINQIEQYISSDTRVILVGTKSDMKNRCVHYEEGKKLAEFYGIKFFETSAKKDIKVKEMFHDLTKDMMKVLLENTDDDAQFMNNSEKIERFREASLKSGRCNCF